MIKTRTNIQMDGQIDRLMDVSNWQQLKYGEGPPTSHL